MFAIGFYIPMFFFGGGAGYADQKGFAGFFVSSDRDVEKFVHFVSFDEWQKVINLAVENKYR